jgi:predicted permease
MRPTNVAYFEWIFLATLALGAVQSWLGWDEAVQLASPTFVLTIQILTFGLIIALVLLVTKVGVLGAGWITFAQLVGQCFALALMFTPSARAWLKREPAHA